MNPKSTQNRSQEHWRNPSETALAPESPPGPIWTSFWASFGPPGPHFFEKYEIVACIFAEMFEKTHVFGIPKPFRTHFKFRSI